MPARWIRRRDQDSVRRQGAITVEPAEVLATHLLEISKRNFPRLLTLKALRRLLDAMTQLSSPDRNAANRRLLDELIPDRVPIESLHAVLRLLLAERVSIRNLAVILETIAESRTHTKNPEALCELVRQRLGPQIIEPLRRADGTIPLIQFAPSWEQIFATHQADSDVLGQDVALPPEVFEKLAGNLAQQANAVAEKGLNAAIITTARRRRFISAIANVRSVSLPVLSYEEIGLEARPALVAIVQA